LVLSVISVLTIVSHSLAYFEKDWYWPSPLLNPELYQERARRLKWSQEKLQAYDQNLNCLRTISERYQRSESPAENEMGRLATDVVKRWEGAKPFDEEVRKQHRSGWFSGTPAEPAPPRLKGKSEPVIKEA
jgi:hypothetical protein